MGYVVSASRGSWGRLHRDDVPCYHRKQSKTIRPATAEEIESLDRCKTCFPKDWLKRVLTEEGVRYREAQRLAEETAPAIVAMLVDMTKGE